MTRPEHPEPRTYERERELIEAQSLDAAIRMFLERWTPLYSHEYPVSRSFEADFVQIVQRIYREAQAPFIKAAGEAMARLPMTPFIIKSDDAKSVPK